MSGSEPPDKTPFAAPLSPGSSFGDRFHIERVVGGGGMGFVYEAMDLYKRALSLRERIFGGSQPDVAASLSAIATLHQAQEQYTQAEPLYRTALVMLENTLGPEHPDTLKCMNRLGQSLLDLGRYVEAEKLSRNVLEMSKRVHDAEHRTTLISMCQLAIAREELGHYVPISG